jgi:hypothetical protein
MRTALAILALAVGCIGCHDKQTSTVAPAPEPGERPSFYDTDNIEEYYGRCPKCQQWVKGRESHLSYRDANAKRGAGFFVVGKCEHCEVSLTEEARPLTNDSRIVRWRVP